MNSILLLDNYDSFTYNLYHLVQKNYNGEVIVKRDYEIKSSELNDYDAFIISPGPGRPQTTPEAMKILTMFSESKPILGICLGMQCINEFFGGKTVKADKPMHGKSSKFLHNNRSSIFIDIPIEINIARYHSLVVEPSKDLVISGHSLDGTVMAIEHKILPIFGLQFHPESFLSEYGDDIIKNFLDVAGLNG